MNFSNSSGSNYCFEKLHDWAATVLLILASVAILAYTLLKTDNFLLIHHWHTGNLPEDIQSEEGTHSYYSLDNRLQQARASASTSIPSLEYHSDQTKGSPAAIDILTNESAPFSRTLLLVDGAVLHPERGPAPSIDSSLKVLPSSTPASSTPSEDEGMSGYISEHEVQLVNDLQDIGTQFD